MPYYPPRPEESSDHLSSDCSVHRRNILRRTLICASVLLIVYGAVRLIGYGSDLVASRQTASELREIAAETDDPEESALPAEPATELPVREAAISPAPPADETEGVPVRSDVLPVVNYPNGYELVSRIQKIRKKSEYVIGWITMEELDEPVAQKDNSFFLNHDATGKRNGNGALFMDEGTSLLTRPYTILVYGHNMKSGAMFGNLRKYEEFSYCYQHRVFQFDTLYEEGQYAIFAVETISLTPGKGKYVNLIDLESTDRETRRNALQALENHSLHNAMLDVNEEDQILLLVTCTGDDDERLIVAARRLRDGEREDHLTMKTGKSMQ